MNRILSSEKFEYVEEIFPLESSTSMLVAARRASPARRARPAARPPRTSPA